MEGAVVSLVDTLVYCAVATPTDDAAWSEIEAPTGELGSDDTSEFANEKEGEGDHAVGRLAAAGTAADAKGCWNDGDLSGSA